MNAPQPPRLVATFVMEDGQPSYVDTTQLRHYRVMFEVLNIPENTYAVTFELDPTYYDPVRTVRIIPGHPVTFTTTSYGEYPIKVRLRTKDGEVLISENLSDALMKGCGPNPSDVVGQAIQRIRDN